ELTIDDGRVTAVVLDVPRLPIGELVTLSDVRFSYGRESDGTETWSGTGSVTTAGGNTAAASISFEIGPDQALRSGTVSVERLSWGGLVEIDSFTLSGQPTDAGFAWDVAGDLAVAGGSPTTIDGRLVIDDGRVVEGELVLTGLRVAGLVEITRLELAADRGDGTWSASVELGSGATASGTFAFTAGRLDAASLALGAVDVGELLTLDDLVLTYDSGASWSASATITDEDGTSTLAGALELDGGAVVGGQLELADVQLGPLELVSLDLVAASSVDVDGADVPLAGVCGVDEPSGLAGTRWAAQAVVRTGEDGTSSVAGRLRLDDGRITDAVLCGSGIQIADIVVLDEVRLGYQQVGGPQPADRWFGDVTISDPDAPAAPFTGLVDFTVADRRLESFELTASGLDLGDLLSLEDLELTFDRSDDDQVWSLGASLGRPGATPGSIDGSLEIDDGTIVGGSLFIADLPFGDAFTLTDLEIEYEGRRARSEPFDSQLPLGLVGLTESNGCGLVPSGSNVPSGTPTTSGPESYYRVGAAVVANGTEFAVGGSLSFADGKLTSFDVTLDCVPLGDWMMLQDVRLLYATGDQFVIAGRLDDDDPTTSNPRFTGSLVFDDGRLAGGSLRLGAVPIGAAALERFDLTLGQQPNGTSVWGASLEVRGGDGQVLGGGGSITMVDGKVTGGSLSIPEIPIADLIVIENVTLAFDGSQPNRSRLAGSAAISSNSGAGGSMAIDLSFEEGKLVAGSFSAGAVQLFDIIPVGSFSLSFDSDTKSWSASLAIGGGANDALSFASGPSIRAGVEIRHGRLISGIIGFDGDGDGEVDAPAANGDAPASGSGSFAGLPLRAFYLRYCADASSAPFCGPGLEDTWDGRVTIELDTQAAPSLDAQLRIKDGRFASAAIDLGFPAPGIPVFTGVFLNSIGATLELDPRLRFCGGLGLTVGGNALTVARLDASIEFSEEPLPYDPPPPELCELTPPGEVPDDWEPEYLRFLIQGIAELFPGNPLGIDINGQAYLELQTRGYLGAGAQFEVEFIENTLGVVGFAEGSLFNANRVPATNPKTGQPLTGAIVQLTGGVAAQVLGHDVAQAAFVVNTVGAAACAGINFGIFGEARLGAGIYWSGGTRLTCDLGRYLIIVPNTVGFSGTQGVSATGVDGGAAGVALGAVDRPAVYDQSSEGGRAADRPAVYGPAAGGVTAYDRLAAAVPVQSGGVTAYDRPAGSVPTQSGGPAGEVVAEFPVPAGEDLLGVDVLGTGGAPDVRLISPSGVVYQDDVSDPSTGMLISTSADTKYFVVALPEPGIWRIERLPGSVPVDTVTTYLELPTASVTGSVSPLGGGSFALDAEILDITGQEVMFVEREPGGPVLAGIGVWASPDEASGTTERRFEFLPGGSASGGPREVVALVLQDGFQRDEIVVATYDAPAATPAGAPSAVRVTEVDGGATVTWAAPADTGGREIVGYRITSTTGFAVTVGPDDRSAAIAIPMMTPGAEVPVIVEARTGVGWGEPGWATFVSTQESGPMYSAAPSDAGSDPGLGPVPGPVPPPGAGGDPGVGSPGAGSPGAGSPGAGAGADPGPGASSGAGPDPGADPGAGSAPG
ncbi:MAG TPA: fibronectin type III domain-containing protein, partial [Acidimicrobiales bacterium]|nr:fibronectin type III domain-containing protein [Acidimicrobiales bacterium]